MKLHSQRVMMPREMTPVYFRMNLHSERKVATHLCLVCRIELTTRSPSRSGESLRCCPVGGGPASDVIPTPKARRR
jgi:hypothetical protein